MRSSIPPILSIVALLIGTVSAFPFSHDYDWLTQRFGNDSPYRQVAATDSITAQYTIEQLHVLQRHGTRYPKPSDTKLINKVLQKLQKASNKTAVDWISNYNNEYTKQNAFQLATTGELELYGLGKRMATSYADLIDPITRGEQLPGNDVFESYVSRNSRTQKSALAFHRGLFEHAPSPTGLLDQYSQRFVVDKKHITSKHRSMLAEDCDHSIYDEPTRLAKQQQCISRFGSDAANRLSKTLGGGGGKPWTPNDIYGVYLGCAFDVGLGKRTDTFCSLLSRQEIEGMYYCIDLWYDSTLGYDNRLGKGVACDLMRDTVHNIMQYHPGTAAPEAKAEAKKLITRIGHDSMIDGVVMVLGLFEDAPSLQPDWSIEQINQRQFQGSKVSPFAANMVFQLLSEGSGNSTDQTMRVRFMLNEEPVILPGCQDEACPLGTFISWIQQRLDQCPDYEDACSRLADKQL